jgi:hypothetical protein
VICRRDLRVSVNGVTEVLWLFDFIMRRSHSLTSTSATNGKTVSVGEGERLSTWGHQQEIPAKKEQHRKTALIPPGLASVRSVPANLSNFNGAAIGMGGGNQQSRRASSTLPVSRHGQQHNSLVNGKHVVATLDLHFQKREQAISSLTHFLSNVVVQARKAKAYNTRMTKSDDNANALQQKNITPKDARPGKNGSEREIWVLVITGTGRHSGSSGGPVIRSAVQQLLDKRCMSYQLVNGKGAFLVQADSGFALYQPEAYTDTKLLIKSVDSEEADQKDAVRRILHPKSGSVRTQSLLGGDVSTPRFVDNPLPREVHEEAEALRLSMEEHTRQETLRRKDADQEILQKTMSLSLAATAASMQHKKGMLHREEEEEETAFRKVMEESLKLEQQQQAKEEQALREVLALSTLEGENDDYERLWKGSLQEQDDEEALQRILELSKDMSHMTTEEDLLRMAMECSLNDL